jgi:hypothetical protein
MVRYLPDGVVVGADALLAFRGDHLVLLSAADGGVALKASCPWLAWAGVVDGDNALTYAEFVYLVMRKRPAEAVLVLTPEGHHFAMPGLARVWDSYRANGLDFDGPMTMQALDSAMDTAADAAGDGAVFQLADMAPSQPAAAPVGGAGGFPLGGAPHGAGGFAFNPAVVGVRPRDVTPFLTFGRLCPDGDSRASVLSTFYYFVGTHILAAQRDEGTHFCKSIKAVIAASLRNAGRQAEDAEDVAVTVARELAASLARGLFTVHIPVGAERRTELSNLLRLRGEPDTAMVKERLPAALAGTELPRLGVLLEGVASAQTLAALAAEAAQTLGIAELKWGEMHLRSLERALVECGCSLSGEDAAARLLGLREYVSGRKAGFDAAPRQDAPSNSAGDGVVALASHNKMHIAALFECYETSNFKGQERAIVRFTEATGALFLALTGKFLSARVGSSVGPIDDREYQEATATGAYAGGEPWAPLAPLHGLIFGKLESLAGKPELGKLVAWRIHMPRLLGLLAVRGLHNVDEAANARLLLLELPELWAQLQQKSWRTTLDIYNSVWLPLLACYHDEPLSAQSRLQNHAAVADMSTLAAVAEPLAQVMQIVCVPLSGKGSVGRVLAPIQSFYALHAPGARPEQLTSISAACAAYLRTCLEDYVVHLNLFRFETSPNARMTAVFGEGNGPPQLTLSMASFASATARKRSGNGGGAEMGTPIKFPRTCWQAITSVAAMRQTVAFAGVDGRASPGPALRIDGAAGAGGGKMPKPGPTFTAVAGDAGKWSTTTGWEYDAKGALQWLNANGGGHKCLKAMLLSGAPPHAFTGLVKHACTVAHHETDGSHTADVPGWEASKWVTKRGKASGRKGGN